MTKNRVVKSIFTFALSILLCFGMIPAFSTSAASTDETQFASINAAFRDALMNSTDLESIRQQYEMFLRTHPGSQYLDDAQYMKGIVSFNEMNSDEYLEDMQKTADIYPDGTLTSLTKDFLSNVPTPAFGEGGVTSICARYAIAQRYNNPGWWPDSDYEKANTLINSIISDYPNYVDDSEFAYQVIVDDQQAGNMTQAVTDSKAYIAKYPSNKQYSYLCYNNIGSTDAANGNLDELSEYAKQFATKFSATDYFTESTFPNGGKASPIYTRNITVTIDSSNLSAAKVQEATDAFAEWKTASGNKLTFTVKDGKAIEILGTDTPGQSDIYIKGTDLTGTGIGGSTFSVGDGTYLDQSLITVDSKASDNAFYTEILHEIGHALGLGHSYNSSDIMFFCGDYNPSGIAHLSQRDINTLNKYVALIPDTTNSSGTSSSTSSEEESSSSAASSSSATSSATAGSSAVTSSSDSSASVSSSSDAVSSSQVSNTATSSSASNNNGTTAIAEGTSTDNVASSATESNSNSDSSSSEPQNAASESASSEQNQTASNNESSAAGEQTYIDMNQTTPVKTITGTSDNSGYKAEISQDDIAGLNNSSVVEVSLGDLALDIPVSVLNANMKNGTLSVSVTTPSDQDAGIDSSSLDSTMDLLDAYEINLTNTATGEQIHQLDGVVQVKIKMTDDMANQITDASAMKLYYFNPATGSMEDMNATFDTANKLVSFNSTHFSTYLVVRTHTISLPDPVQNQMGLAIWLICGAAVLILGSVMFVIIKRKKQYSIS